MITFIVNYETALHVLLYLARSTASTCLAYYSQNCLQKNKTKKYPTLLRITLPSLYHSRYDIAPSRTKICLKF